MERNSFVFYDSFYKAISKLKPEEQSLCLKALCDYCFKGESPKEDNPIVNMFFELIKPQIDTNNKRYENGCKGGRPKNQIITKVKPNDNQTKTKTEKLKPNDNVNDNDNEKECEGRCDDITTLDAKASRVPTTTTQSNVISGLGKEKTQDIKQTNTQWLYNDVGSALWFEDIYKNFYHKNWIKKDEKKSRKLFDTMNFSQKELQDILYDEKLFKFEFKYRIKDPQYRPKFDTYLSGFNRDWDRQWDDRLYEIAKYHMTHKDDLNKMKERSTELKEAFWESKFKEIAHNVWRELSRVNLVIK